jgi:hypothetical protein
VLAVNERLSIQGIMQRYEGQRQARGFGRMTTPEAHQAGYDGVLRSVDRIERDGLADTISVYRRGAIKIYENEMTPQGWQREPFARAAIEAERARPFSIEEAAQYLAGYDRLADVISRPERAATPAERQQIEGLRIAARQEFEGVAVAADRSARFLRTDQADAGRHPDLRPAFERLALVQAALTSAGISGEARDATMAQARQRIADELATGRELRPVSLTDGPPAPRIRR